MTTFTIVGLSLIGFSILGAFALLLAVFANFRKIADSMKDPENVSAVTFEESTTFFKKHMFYICLFGVDGVVFFAGVICCVIPFLK